MVSATTVCRLSCSGVGTGVFPSPQAVRRRKIIGRIKMVLFISVDLFG
jgi:hypothetical protein